MPSSSKYSDYVKRTLILGGSTPSVEQRPQYPDAASVSRQPTQRYEADDKLARMRAVLDGNKEPRLPMKAEEEVNPAMELLVEPRPSLVSNESEASIRASILDKRFYPHAARHATGSEELSQDAKMKQMRDVLGTELSFRGPSKESTKIMQRTATRLETTPLAETSGTTTESRLSFKDRVKQGEEIQKEIAEAEAELRGIREAKRQEVIAKEQQRLP